MRSAQKESWLFMDHAAAEGRRIIWLSIAAIAVFLCWAAFAPLNEVVRGAGTVVPTVRSQVVQNLEGGIVREVFVSEGDVVETGQRIVQMDKTQFESAYKELQEQRLALLLKLERLQAEGDLQIPFVPTGELAEKAPEYALSEKALYEARAHELKVSLENLEKAERLKHQEVAMLELMAQSSTVPEIDLVRAQLAVTDVRIRIDSLRREFETARSNAYLDTLVKLRQVEEQMSAKEDQLRRTNVVSPIKGIVNKVFATTIGGVVGPGGALVEILPIEEPLRIEGRIDPRDIGFVYTGMFATVKLSAYDPSIYGTLPGYVAHVGADTVVDDAERQPRPYYEVFVELDRRTLEGPTGSVEIRPGMLADVELKAGQKTVLQYLLKPLSKTTNALSER